MEATEKKRFFIIDGNAYIYRSFHAIRELATSTGVPTNAIFGFMNMMMKILRESKPEYLVITFDTAAPTFRHKEYVDYKKDRPGMPDELAQQFPVVKHILEALCIPIVEKPGFEADDIIGTLAKKAENAGMDVTIVTSDKDAFQLVSPNIKIRPYGFRGIKDEDFTYDENEVINKYDVPPSKITDLLGLMGDTSDSIPGVPSIGPKTAASLLNQFDSMEELLDHLDEVKNERIRELLRQYADQAKLSKRLATLDLFVPINDNLEDYKIELSDKGLPASCREGELLTLFHDLEFRKFIKDLDLLPEQDKQIETSYHTILSESELNELAKRLKESTEFAIDTETNGLDPIKSELVGISISLKPNEAYYIPIQHRYIGVPEQLPMETVVNILKPILEDPNIGKIGQNIKYDLQILRNCGIELKGMSFDTMIASYVINPLTKHDLDNISMELLNHKMIPIEELIGKGKDQRTMEEVEVEKVSEYSCEDADITMQLKNFMHPKLTEYGLDNVFHEIELPLISVLADMEMIGIKIDTKWLKYLSDKLFKQLESLTSEIYDLAGEEFNINSTQQLGKILFDKLNMPTGKKTKSGGYSTNEAELAKLSLAGYKLPSKMLEYRTLAKLKSTYVDALPQNINPKTGRVHTSFNQAVTETGRLSSSNPNLQNIPIRTEEGREIRRAFIPDNDCCVLVTADYSQIELRMLAHLSKDKALTEAFANNQDIHASTAALIFDVPIDQITPEMRRQAKTINFGVIYGMGAFRLANELGISNSEAQKFIDEYFATYAGVKTYFDKMMNFARENGYVTTISGRRRFIREINSSDHNQRAFGERIAINTPVQGSAADMIKLAMIKIADLIKSEKWETKLLLQVHDELVFDVPEDELEKVVPHIRSLMENALKLDVPIKVDVGVGKSWLEAK
jgi:DNA polymerase-1